MSWSKERIEGLTTLEIKSLMHNATERGRHEVVDLCRNELLIREKASPPRRTRSAINPSKQLEFQMDERLISVQRELSEIFDLSPQTAKCLSTDSKGFKAHEQLSSKGRSKTGAHQTKTKRAKIDRYISYRINENACALVCLLLDEDDGQVRFQVMGPREYLENNYKEPKQLRPYLADDENLGAYQGGEEYSSFEEAADRYKWLIERLAPKLPRH